VAVPSELQSRQARTQRLQARGVAGTAVVTAVRDTGATVGMDPEVEFDLEICVDPASVPYAVTHRQVVSELALTNMGAGASVPVRVDPGDPQSVLIA
jgi:hypothetical protein